MKATTDIDDKNASFKRDSDGNKDDKYAIVLLISCVYANSFVELVRHVFTYPGVKYCLSEKICQDPLEKFFWMSMATGTCQ